MKIFCCVGEEFCTDTCCPVCRYDKILISSYHYVNMMYFSVSKLLVVLFHKRIIQRFLELFYCRFVYISSKTYVGGSIAESPQRVILLIEPTTYDTFLWSYEKLLKSDTPKSWTFWALRTYHYILRLIVNTLTDVSGHVINF